MSVVRDGSVYQVGTYNGNPLGTAAARASLLEVLTPGAYEHLERLNGRLTGACDDVIAKYRLPAYTVGIGAKGCVTFSPDPITDFAFRAHRDPELSQLHWLYTFNRGIYTTPNRDREWTLSVTHDEQAVDAYAAVFEEMAAQLRS